MCAMRVVIEIHFFVRRGVLIFLLRWLEYLPVKLMCPKVELLLCMCTPVKIFGRLFHCCNAIKYAFC
jgi:hypothetical protein